MRVSPIHWGDPEIQTYNYVLQNKCIGIIAAITNEVIPYSNTSKPGDSG